jgi:hypothetical protein
MRRIPFLAVSNVMAARLFFLAASTAALVSAQTTAGCTAKSFSYPSWIIQDVKHTDGAVSFSIANRVTNSTASLACQVKAAGVNACVVQGTPNDSLKVSVAAGDNSTTFTVNQSWDCNDRGKV